MELYIYIYIYIHIYYHHDVRLARISLTLSLHVSQSFIASGRSSGLHPVSSHSCFWLAICRDPQEHITYDLIYIYIYIYIYNIGTMVRVFANGLGDSGSIPGRVIPKTKKIVFDASLLNTQHYKVRIKDKVEQFRKMSFALPNT